MNSRPLQPKCSRLPLTYFPIIYPLLSFKSRIVFGSTRWIRTNLSSAYKADARTVCARADGTEEKNRTSIARLSAASTNHCRTPVYFGGKVQSRTEINSFSDCSLDHRAYLTITKTHHKKRFNQLSKISNSMADIIGFEPMINFFLKFNCCMRLKINKSINQ